MQTSAASEKVNFDETDRHAADCLEHHSGEIKHKNPMSVYVDGNIFFFEKSVFNLNKAKALGWVNWASGRLGPCGVDCSSAVSELLESGGKPGTPLRYGQGPEKITVNHCGDGSRPMIFHQFGITRLPGFDPYRHTPQISR